MRATDGICSRRMDSARQRMLRLADRAVVVGSIVFASRIARRFSLCAPRERCAYARRCQRSQLVVDGGRSSCLWALVVRELARSATPWLLARWRRSCCCSRSPVRFRASRVGRLAGVARGDVASWCCRVATRMHRPRRSSPATSTRSTIASPSRCCNSLPRIAHGRRQRSRSAARSSPNSRRASGTATLYVALLPAVRAAAASRGEVDRRTRLPTSNWRKCSTTAPSSKCGCREPADEARPCHDRIRRRRTRTSRMTV